MRPLYLDNAMSIFNIDLNTNKVVDKFKTGYQIGEMIEGAEVVGGVSPNSIVIGNEYAYVSNATNDNISIIDYGSLYHLPHAPLNRFHHESLFEY